MKTQYKISQALLLTLMLCAASSSMAQLYKTIGPDGKVTYSDTPPPVGKAERKTIGGNGATEANIPYELALASRNHPVTFYSMEKCPVCDEARSLLRKRGIPYSEKTVASAEDQLKLRDIAGGIDLPVLMVGREKKQGFEPGAWQAALTAAGYPTSNKLPPNYAYRAPEPAAPVAPKPTPKPTPVAAPVEPAPEPTVTPESNRPGFRF